MTELVNELYIVVGYIRYRLYVPLHGIYSTICMYYDIGFYNMYVLWHRILQYVLAMT